MSKVVIVYSGGRQWGGIETYLANLFRLHDPGEMDLLLASMGEWELTRALEGGGYSPSIRLLSGKRVRMRTVFDLRRLLRQEQAGLLVSQGVVANAYARLAATLAHVPSLVVVHSDMALDYPRRLARSAFLLVDRALRPITRRYLVVCGYLKDQLVRSGVDPGKVSVIYNGVGAVGRPQRSAAQAHARTSEGSGGRPGAHIRLASVGRLHPVKNFAGLIKAVRLLPEDTELVIWGDGAQRSELEALIRQLNLQGRVKLPGESQTMAEALAGIDLYVQPSLSEGCSFTVAEAMLHGKPVLVTPCGGLPEQVEDGRSGLVAGGTSPEELAAAITAFLKDQKSAGTLAENGRKTAEEKFSMDSWLRATLEAFRQTADPLGGYARQAS